MILYYHIIRLSLELSCMYINFVCVSEANRSLNAFFKNHQSFVFSRPNFVRYVQYIVHH